MHTAIGFLSFYIVKNLNNTYFVYNAKCKECISKDLFVTNINSYSYSIRQFIKTS